MCGDDDNLVYSFQPRTYLETDHVSVCMPPLSNPTPSRTIKKHALVRPRRKLMQKENTDLYNRKTKSKERLLFLDRWCQTCIKRIVEDFWGEALFKGYDPLISYLQKITLYFCFYRGYLNKSILCLSNCYERKVLTIKYIQTNSWVNLYILKWCRHTLNICKTLVNKCIRFGTIDMIRK